MNAIVGDGAYYLTAQDGRCRASKKYATFELCEQKSTITGKRVALTYKMGEVNAQSCGGEPICAQHDRVPLAIKARNLADSTLPTPAKASFSLCTSQETVVFSCGTGAKVVSVCASPGASRTGGYVQYRFGVPGAPEITLPATRVSPSQASTGATETYSGGGSAWLRFQQGGYGYVVYAGIGRWGSRGETRDVAGVVVEQPRAANMNMKCVGKITSLLGPDWFGEMGIQRKTPDESFELPNP